MNRRIFGALGALALVAAVLSCADDPTDPDVEEQPVPGALELVLDTPHDDDRGLLLRLSGPDSIGAVVAAEGLVAHTRSTSAVTNVAVFGEVFDGVVLSFDVPDTRRVADYAVTLIDATGPDAELRTGGGYSFVIRRP